MKIFALTLIVIAAHVAVTLAARAQETIPSESRPNAAQTPHFITQGNPLTGQELAVLNQRFSAESKISKDAGGVSDTGKVLLAVAVGVVIAVAAIAIAQPWKEGRAGNL